MPPKGGFLLALCPLPLAQYSGVVNGTSKAIKCRQKMGEKLLSKRDRNGIYLVFHGLISPASLRGRPCDYVSCITMTL